jgi:PIN domain nuclease of toxin-antitoxin system
MPADAVSVLLDTHVLLWWRADARRLSASAVRAIGTARHVLVSPVTCWEVGMLVSKERVRLDRPTAAWVRDLLAEDRIQLAPLTPAAAVAAAELSDFHGDPADRMLYATARSLRALMITKDRQIHQYAATHRDVSVRW